MFQHQPHTHTHTHTLTHTHRRTNICSSAEFICQRANMTKGGHSPLCYQFCSSHLTHSLNPLLSISFQSSVDSHTHTHTHTHTLTHAHTHTRTHAHTHTRTHAHTHTHTRTHTQTHTHSLTHRHTNIRSSAAFICQRAHITKGGHSLTPLLSISFQSSVDSPLPTSTTLEASPSGSGSCSISVCSTA